MSINKVILIGNLGDAPELRVMPSGASACNFSVATSESWKDKNGEKQEKTEWHRCSAFDRGNYKMAEYIAQGCQKGTKIYIEGKLETRKYEKDGIERYATEVKVESFEILANGVPRDGQQGGYQQPAPQPMAQPQTFGSFGGDPWEGFVPAGAAAKATIDQIKQKAGGNVEVAKANGWVTEGDDIPF